jgi:hypothetical protein
MTYSIDDYFAPKPGVGRIKEDRDGFALQDRRVCVCACLLWAVGERIGH